ncbi:MAG: tetratricopeptide repeat protein [Planctomycetaceae bacterium]
MLKRLLSFQKNALIVGGLVVAVAGCGDSKPEATAAITSGQVAKSHGQYADAIQEFTKALLRDPNNAEALNLRGQTYADVGNETAAIKDLQQAIKVSPDWADPWYHLAMVNRKAGNTVNAIKNFTQAINRNDRHTEALMARGELLWDMGDRNKALEDLKAGVDSAPDKVENCRKLASYQLEVGSLNSAITTYSKILQRDPDATDAWLARSECHNKVGQQQFALLDLNEAMRRLPDSDSSLRYRRVHLLKLLERDDEVVSELEAIARQEPEDLLLRKEIVDLAEKAGNHRAILAASTEVLRQEPDNYEMHRRRGLANYRLDNKSDAVSDISNAIQYSPDDIDLHLLRARLQKENRDYIRLITSTNQIVKRWPDTAEAYFLRAQGQLALANESAALRNLIAGLKHDPENETAIALRDNIQAERAERLRIAKASRGKSYVETVIDAIDSSHEPFDDQPAKIKPPRVAAKDSAPAVPHPPVDLPKEPQQAVAKAPSIPPTASTPSLPAAGEPTNDARSSSEADGWAVVEQQSPNTLVETPTEPKTEEPKVAVRQTAPTPPTEASTPAPEEPVVANTQLVPSNPTQTAPTIPTLPVEDNEPFEPAFEEPQPRQRVVESNQDFVPDDDWEVQVSPAELASDTDAAKRTSSATEDVVTERSNPQEQAVVDSTINPEPTRIQTVPSVEQSLKSDTQSNSTPTTEIVSAEPAQQTLPLEQPIATTPAPQTPTYDSIETYLSRGNNYFEKGQWPLAVARFTAGIREYPNETRLYIARSRAFAKMGEISAALTDLQFAQERNPEYMTGWQRLGGLYLEAGKFQQAVDTFTRIVNETPTDVAARIGRGRAFNGLDDLAAAKADLDVAVQTAPKNADARMHRSYVSAKLKQYDSVITDTTKAMELAGDDPELRYRRGVALIAVGKPGLAVDDLSVFLKRNPTNKHALAQRAHAYAVTGMHDASIADWSEVLAIDPGYPQALGRRAMAFTSGNDHGAALADLSKAISQSPTAELYYQRALTYRRLGKPTEAMDNLGNAIRANPRYVDAFEHRAMILAGKGQISNAIVDLSSAIAADPERATTYYNRGVLFSRTEQFEKALDDYNTALMLNKKFASCFLRRGMTHQKLGHIDEAIKDYAAASKEDENLYQAHYYRARLNLQKKDFESAISAYKQTLARNNKLAGPWFELGEAFAGAGNQTDAFKSWSEAISRNPKHYQALTRRGVAHAKDQRFDEAARDLRSAASANAEYAPAWNSLAQLRATCPDAAQRNPMEAVMFARKACELTKLSRWDYLQTLATAYAEAGDYNKAQEWATRAISRAPEPQKASIRKLAEKFQSGQTSRQ